MSTFTERRKRLRELIASKQCLMPGSVHDALSARIAEELGYEAVMLAGSVASLAVLGAPDLILLTLSELAEQVHRICRATTLPLFIDADHGYGNALNAARTVEELEHAGAAGFSLEDTVLPRTYGETTPALTSIEEGVGKMKAALAARRDPNLVIAGRTSALAIHGLDDAIARAKAYEAAGVDMMFIIGAKTKRDMEAISTAIKIPLIIGGPTPEISDSAYLASQRVRIRIPPHLPITAAAQALHTTLSEMRKGTPAAQIPGLPKDDLMKRISREAEYAKQTEAWVGGKG
jgi:carboxyvinyl-carboxyphosphonate phosphorylmutase